MKLDMLAELEDAELRAVIVRAEELLAQHDRERKEKALAQARATLAAVGLSLKDVANGKTHKPAKGAAYHIGRLYQHPTNKALTWNGKGKKPGWLLELESQGIKPIEAANEIVPPVKKAG